MPFFLVELNSAVLLCRFIAQSVMVKIYTLWTKAPKLVRGVFMGYLFVINFSRGAQKFYHKLRYFSKYHILNKSVTAAQLHSCFKNSIAGKIHLNVFGYPCSPS